MLDVLSENSIKFGTFKGLGYFKFLLQVEKSFEDISQKLTFKGEWDNLRTKTCLITQSQKNNLYKATKSSKIGHNWKKILSALGYFLTAIAKPSFLEASLKLDPLALGYVSNQIQDFSNIF